MKAATTKMLQELGAFILAGAKGKRDVKIMAEMIAAARRYCWVGIYKLNSREFTFIAGTGNEKPSCPRFPKTLGLCSAAAEAHKTVVVPDVRKDVRYIPAFHKTRSEIVVPIISRSEKCVGVIVADSSKVRGFKKEDRDVLERVALMMGQGFK